MSSQCRTPGYAAAAICIGLAWLVSACANFDRERPASPVEPFERFSSRSDAYQGWPYEALIAQAPQAVPIDPVWPRRVANLVGFAPPDIAEDYTARFMAKPTSRAVGETLFVVRRRGHWVRIDERFEGRIDARLINLSTETVVSIDGGAPSGRSAYLVIEPLTEALWSGQARLVSLRKEALLEADVVPPAHLFDLHSWAAPIPPELEPASYSVVLQATCCSTPILIERRRGSLRSREQISGEQRRVSMADDRGGFQFDAAYTPDGRLVRLAVRTNALAPSAPTSSDGGPAEIVLGETCHWEDRAPGLHDAVWEQCRASDGAPLIDVSGGRGHSTRLTAVNISREPLPLGAVLPPSAAFSSFMP